MGLNTPITVIGKIGKIFCDSMHYKIKEFSRVFYSNGKIIEKSKGGIDAEINFNGSVKIRQSLQAGQPIYRTHSHLLNHGEITTGLKGTEYDERRTQLMDLLLKKAPRENHVLIMPGFSKKYKIDKIPQFFRQDTDMLYLSGCNEPDCILVLHTLPSKSITVTPCYKSIMFTPPLDPGQAVWDGPRTCPSGAPNVWNVDEGLPTSEISKYLANLEQNKGVSNIWFNAQSPTNNEAHQLLKEWFLREHQSHKITIRSPKEFIHELRSIKSPAEIALMKETCKITSNSIEKVMRGCTAPVAEHNLFAAVDYHCRIAGAEGLAYPPVVAGGSRANAIHYINNNNIINPGELVLMDAGCEYRGYSGDITRTWPVNGSFSSGQRDLYEALLYVQKLLIISCAERPCLDQLYSLMCSKLGVVLKELSILPKDMSCSHIPRAVYGLCPHHVSHYLGMDVHDTALIGRNRALISGNIITVEPGIYISPHNNSVPSRFKGLAMRIEDDILITDNGIEVLSALCPKEPEDIEAIVGIDVL